MDNGGQDKEGVISFETGEPLENERHELFCLEYLARGRSATRAYQFVYPGTNYQSAASAGSRLLKNVEVRARIEQLHQEQVERLKATADRVLCETGKLAFVSVRDLLDAEGQLIPLKDLDPEVAAAITSIEFEEIYTGQGKNRKVVGRVAKVKLADKYRGLELLGKRLKVFSDKVEVTHKATLEDLLSGEDA